MVHETAPRPEFGFDTMTGSLLVGQLAIEQHIEQGGDVTPLSTLLESRQPYTGTPGQPSEAEWSVDERVAYGKWIFNVIQTSESDVVELHKHHLDRAHELGLGPSSSFLVLPFARSIGKYKQEIGSSHTFRTGAISGWSKSELIEYAYLVHDWIAAQTGEHRSLKPDDYTAASKAGLGPAGKAMQEYVRLGELNHYLGYVNTRDWSREDFLDWGAQVIRAKNGSVRGMKPAIDRLGREDLGPSGNAVKARFDTVAAFAHEAYDEYERQEAARAERLMAYRADIRDSQLPGDLADKPAETILAAGGRKLLAAQPELGLAEALQSVLVKLTSAKDFFSALYVYGGHGLRPDEIRSLAKQLDVYHDITGPNERLRLR